MQSVVSANGDAIAVREATGEVSYTELARMVGACREMLQSQDPEGRAPVGLLLDRSAEAYAAIWATLGAGRAYVPLNLRYPASRLETIVAAAGIEIVVCHPSTVKLAQTLGIDDDRIIVLTKDSACALTATEIWTPGPAEGDIAYILYTSGSTGQPKGVPITCGNLLAFTEAMMEAIPYPPGSICGQVCELSFDFSVHEIYVALLSAATLCPARQIDLFNPAAFIAKNEISVWICVPSLARVLLANQRGQQVALPSVTLSIFNGEPLTANIAGDWQLAVPNATIWNTYGPTECTVAVTAQRWKDRADLSENDVVSIGTALPGCKTAVLEGDRIVSTEVATDGLTGELLLAGPQCFDGYADEAIADPFVNDADGTRYYRTGDKVVWRDGRLFHIGRLDHQVKIGGHRIELMEVEWHLRRVLGTDALAVVTYPRAEPTEMVLFAEGLEEIPPLKTEALGLPAYMLPKRSIILQALPTTPHGKLDRVSLQSMLDTVE